MCRTTLLRHGVRSLGDQTKIQELDYTIYHDWADSDSDSDTLAIGKKGPFYECADLPGNAYHDGQICDKTIEDLKRLAK
jgi:hypothetical protein